MSDYAMNKPEKHYKITLFKHQLVYVGFLLMAVQNCFQKEYDIIQSITAKFKELYGLKEKCEQ